MTANPAAASRSAGRPRLHVDPDVPGLCGAGVNVDGLGTDQMMSLRRHVAGGASLHAILSVSVVQPGTPEDRDLPSMAGRHQFMANGLRFLPAFPFERSTLYRACFCPRALDGFAHAGEQAMAFSFAAEPRLPQPRVTAIFPTSNDLPANLLRFHVVFSNPMQRGAARANIALLRADGAPAADVLYNAPVELWDRSMQRLTLLLDPGRLKRGVGPNRALGPPLVIGQYYALVVGAGMEDASGSVLSGAVHKRFRVVDAIRTPLAIDRWHLAPVAAGTLDKLMLTFPAPLDWALLAHAITVETPCGCRIDGNVTAEAEETRWVFAPNAPWAAGACHLRVAPCLEDLCGNTRNAPFDRPFRSDIEIEQPETPFVIPFLVH